MVQKEAGDVRGMQLNIGASGFPGESLFHKTASHSLVSRCILQQLTESTSLGASCKSHFTSFTLKPHAHTQYLIWINSQKDTKSLPAKQARWQRISKYPARAPQHSCHSTPVVPAHVCSRHQSKKTLTEACKQGAWATLCYTHLPALQLWFPDPQEARKCC